MNSAYFDNKIYNLIQSQGQTISEPNSVYTDLNETFQAAMSYVILSRITSIGQLYLKEFNQKKIYCSLAAKWEAVRLSERAINKKRTEWDQERDDSVRITSLNARSLKQHCEDMKKDDFIMKSDIVCLQETWIEKDPSIPITDFEEHYVNGGSKGIALLTRPNPLKILKFQSETCSVIKAIYDKFDLMNIYKFSGALNIKDFTDEILPLIDLSRTQILLGDFNINLMTNSQNHFTQSLQHLGFQQMVSSPSHVLGGLIDHIYFFSPNCEHSAKLYKSHTVFWSDHICQSVILELVKDNC